MYIAAPAQHTMHTHTCSQRQHPTSRKNVYLIRFVFPCSRRLCLRIATSQHTQTHTRSPGINIYQVMSSARIIMLSVRVCVCGWNWAPCIFKSYALGLHSDNGIFVLRDTRLSHGHRSVWFRQYGWHCSPTDWKRICIKLEHFPDCSPRPETRANSLTSQVACDCLLVKNQKCGAPITRLNHWLQSFARLVCVSRASHEWRLVVARPNTFNLIPSNDPAERTECTHIEFSPIFLFWI